MLKVITFGLAVILVSAPPSEAWVVGGVIKQAIQKSAAKSAAARAAAAAAAAKAAQIAKSPATRKAVITTGVVAGAEQTANFAYNNMSQDTDAGNAYAAEVQTPEVRETPRQRPEPPKTFRGERDFADMSRF